MKTARQMLASLRDTHAFRPLQQHRCYRRFLELLPPRFQHAIAFVTVKNRQLMVALSHPGYKMELNYNQDVLKSLLSTLIETTPECRFMEAERIVIFPSKYHTSPANGEHEETVPRYSELATGDFTIPEADTRLQECFLKIRQDILHNRGATE